MAPADRSLTIISILCPGHSGSTLLEHLLGAHRAVVSGGELKMLGAANRHRVSLEKRSCTCGGGVPPLCAFWRDVDLAIRASEGRGLDELDPEHSEDERFRVDNLALLRALATVSGRSVIVDSSKTLARFDRLRRISGIELLPIRLIRRPYGVVASYLRSGRPWIPWARHYTRHVLRSREMLASLDHAVVRYETLASAPRAALEPLMTRLGLGFEERQLQWPPAIQHSVGGNSMRFERSGEIRLDQRWEHELSALQKAGIAWVTLPTHFPGRRVYEIAKPIWELGGFAHWLATPRRRKRR